MTELHYLSATEVLAAYRSRELSPVEVFDAVTARADATEPTVNSLLERDHDDFRAAAQAAAERYAGKGEPPRPLEGLPVALKEEQPITGRSLRFGSVLTEGLVARDPPRRRAHLRRGRPRPCPHHDPGVLVRGVHPHGPVGRDPQPVEPGLHPGWLLGRIGCSPRGRYDVPGQRLGHRRLDPDPRVLLRSGGLQGAVRPGARAPAVQPRHRTATTERWAARWRTPRCCTT